MRVAYVTMRFPAASETFAGTDIRMLRDAGVQVSVHALLGPEANADRLLVERELTWLGVSHGGFVNVVAGLAACAASPLLFARTLGWLVAEGWRQPGQLITGLLLLPRCFGIMAELRRVSPDVVHLFWGHYPAIVGRLVLASRPQTVLSVFLGAYDLARLFGGTRWLAGRAHVVFTHMQANYPALDALGVPADRIRLAYRGVDLSRFQAVEKTPRRIVAAGRLERMKGMDDVVEVFRAVHARWPDATLRVLGEGEDRDKLERVRAAAGLEKAVEFAGHVSHAEVARELAAAEVFLHMSLEERLPNVVKEAMASGCLCVVTDTEGIDELVSHRTHGFVVRCGDVTEAAARIDAIFNRAVDVDAIRAAAAVHVRERFDVRASMAVYRATWEEATARLRSTETVTNEPAVSRHLSREVAANVREAIR